MFNLVSSRGHGVAPFSFTILVGWIVFGSALAASTFFEGWQPTPAVASSPGPVLFFVGAFITLGAFFTLLSQRNWKRLNTGWALEKIGSYLAFGGWIAYSALAFMQDWRHTGVILLGAIMASATFARHSHSKAYEKYIRTKVKERE